MALPEITVSRASQSEIGHEKLVFAVALSEASEDDVTINYAGFEGTATTDDFHFGGAGLHRTQLTFSAGETTKYIEFELASDGLDETDESIWLELTNAKNAVFAGGESSVRALGVVRDNDGNGSNLALFVSDPKLVEGVSGTKKAVFEVHLSQPHSENLTLAYRTADGSAKAGSDYVAKTGNITFLAGQTVASVEVDVKADTVVETTETFSLIITPTSAIKNGTAASTGTATILDDDTNGSINPTVSVSRASQSEIGHEKLVFAVTLSRASEDDVAINYAGLEGTATTDDFHFGGTGLHSAPLTFKAGETTKYVEFELASDSLDETDESIWLALTNAKNAVFAGGESSVRALGVVRDNDGGGSNLSLFVSDAKLVEGVSGAKKAVFEVHLSQPHGENLTLAYRTANGSAKAGSDYTAKAGNITFLAGQTVASVEVDVKADTVVETTETFSLIITPTSVIKNGTAGSTGTAVIADDQVRNTVYGKSGNDKLYGYGGDDAVYGFNGNDLLDGGTGSDKLYGGNGKDILYGRDGRDVLEGGLGADKLYGEKDGDTFVYRSVKDTTVSTAGRDTIFDLGKGDRINLGAIDANTGLGGNQSFTFIGTKAFSKKAGELRYDKKASDTVIYGDVNGDGKADLAIHLDDAVTLAKGYFLL